MKDIDARHAATVSSLLFQRDQAEADRRRLVIALEQQESLHQEAILGWQEDRRDIEILCKYLAALEPTDSEARAARQVLQERGFLARVAENELILTYWGAVA